MAVGQSSFPAQVDTLDNLIRAANSSATTLSSNINPNATTLTVGSTLTFPTSGTLVIEDEILYFTGKTSTSFTGVTRGEEGTIPSSHSQGTEVRGEITAAHQNTPNQAIINTQTYALEKFTELDARLDALESSANTGMWPGVSSVADFNAAGSAVKFTGSLSLSAPKTLTLTAASDFKAGQGIFVASAGASGAALLTRVDAVSADSLVITLHDNALSAVSGVNVQHDETLAIQTAIDTVMAAGGGAIYFPPGFYRVNGPLTDFNSILKVPFVSPDTSPVKAIQLMGFANPFASWLATGPSTGVIIQSDVIGANANSSILAFNVWDSSTNHSLMSNVTAYISGITFRTYDNPQLSALDLGMCGNIIVKQVVCDVGLGYTAGAQPTHVGVFGFRSPRVNAGCGMNYCECVYSMNYHTGFVISEAFTAQRCTALYCQRGFLLLQSYHSAQGVISSAQCPTMLEWSGFCPVDFYMDIEKSQPGPWYAPTPNRDFYDPLNVATGLIRYMMSRSGTGAQELASNTNATKIIQINVAGLESRMAGPVLLPQATVTGSATIAGSLSISDGSVNQPVSFGANNSATTGFRQLRVDNQGTSTLTAQLVSYWKMDETTPASVRADAKSLNPLTAVGDISVIAGKIGNAADVAGQINRYFYALDSPSLNLSGSSFTLAGWIKINSVATQQNPALIAKWGTTGESEFLLNYGAGSSAWQFLCSSDGTAYEMLTLSHTLVTGTWYFLAASLNVSTNTMSLSFNGGTAVTKTFAGPLHHGPAALSLLMFSAGTYLADAAVDEVGLWNRALSGAEITELYNSGAGKTYPFG